LGQLNALIQVHAFVSCQFQQLPNLSVIRSKHRFNYSLIVMMWCSSDHLILYCSIIHRWIVPTLGSGFSIFLITYSNGTFFSPR
jgi:hypothetical protein